MKKYYQTHKHPMLGRKQSKESIEKSVASRKVTLFNHPEIRKKFGRNLVGKEPWNKGKIMSKEIRQKMHRIKIEDMQELAKKRGGLCLSEEYNGSGNNLRWKCKKSHEWEAKSSNIKSGKWCPKCSYEYRADLQRGNIQDMQKIAESLGGRCLSDKYINVETKLKWQCKNGHIWEAIPSSIKRGSWCPKCVRNKE